MRVGPDFRPVYAWVPQLPPMHLVADAPRSARVRGWGKGQRTVRRVTMMAFALFASACASGPAGAALQLRDAVALHNESKHVLEAVDRLWTPVYMAAKVNAAQAFPDDDKAYGIATERYDHVDTLINAARSCEQIMHLAVSRWRDGLDDGGMLREVADCEAEAFDGLAAALIEITGPVPAQLYAETKVIAMQLAGIAAGAQCSTSGAENAS